MISQLLIALMIIVVFGAALIWCVNWHWKKVNGEPLFPIHSKKD